MRRALFFVVLTALIPALLSIAPLAYGDESSPAVIDDRIHPSPPDDIGRPEQPIKSPGFPSELSGKCNTWQDCFAYCEEHQFEPACARIVVDSIPNKSLYEAVRWSDKSKLAAMLAQGADANARYQDKDGVTPTLLHLAAQTGNTDIAAMLIAHGADVNATDKHGNTPLHEVSDKCSRETVDRAWRQGGRDKYQRLDATALCAK